MMRIVRPNEYIALVHQNHLYIEVPVKDDKVAEEARKFFKESPLSKVTTVFDSAHPPFYQGAYAGGMTNLPSAPDVKIVRSLERILKWAINTLKPKEGAIRKLTQEEIDKIDSDDYTITKRMTRGFNIKYN